MGLGIAEANITGERAYGDLAIALYASPLTLPCGNIDQQALRTYAAQGVEVLGGAEVIAELHARWLSLNESVLRGRITQQEYDRNIRQMFPDERRFERCIGYDMRRFLSDTA